MDPIYDLMHSPLSPINERDDDLTQDELDNMFDQANEYEPEY